MDLVDEGALGIAEPNEDANSDSTAEAPNKNHGGLWMPSLPASKFLGVSGGCGKTLKRRCVLLMNCCVRSLVGIATVLDLAVRLTSYLRHGAS